MKVKEFFRRSSLYLLDMALLFVLLLLAYFMVFALVTSNPDRIKQIVSGSGVYQKITPVLYDNYAEQKVDEQAQSPGGETLPLDNEAVRSAAIKVFTPQFVQNNLETAIEGTYEWLDGDTPQPAFQIDLAEAKNQFAEEIAAAAGNRAETLPVCSPQQLREAQNVNLLSLPCRPPGISIEALKAEFIGEAKKDDGFLSETTVSPATLKDGSGKNVFENYRHIPDTFQQTKKLPYIFAALAVLICRDSMLIRPSGRAKKLAKSRYGRDIRATYTFGIKTFDTWRGTTRECSAE